MNGVISYGGQTDFKYLDVTKLFENGVISYGGQTLYRIYSENQ